MSAGYFSSDKFRYKLLRNFCIWGDVEVQPAKPPFESKETNSNTREVAEFHVLYETEFFWSIFPRVWAKYRHLLVNLSTQSKCEKIGIRNTSGFGLFIRSVVELSLHPNSKSKDGIKPSHKLPLVLEVSWILTKLLECFETVWDHSCLLSSIDTKWKRTKNRNWMLAVFGGIKLHHLAFFNFLISQEGSVRK